MVDVTLQVDRNVYCIDDDICGVPRLHSVYLLNETRKALIDSGPASAVETVLAGIRQAGVDPAEIDYIVLTHVHLDHAGGAGTLLKSMPRAKVVVHRRGARYLTGMERLVASAVAAQGEVVIRDYGVSLPVAAHDIIEVSEGARLDLGNRQALEFMDTPGHAPHELCIREAREGGIFVGDALGLLLGNHTSLFTCHPPPSFDPVACFATIERLRAEKPPRLYFAHFGAEAAVDFVLDQAVARLKELNDLAEAAFASGRTDDIEARLTEKFRAQLAVIDDAEVLKFSTWNLLDSSVSGMMGYYHRKYRDKR